MNARALGAISLMIVLAITAYLAVGHFNNKASSASAIHNENVVEPIGSVTGTEPEAGNDLTPITSGNVGPAPEPGFYSEEEYAQFKESYYCDLARDTRLKCEALDRGPDGLEQCLKLSQYYTYSRHCGTQP